MACSFFWRGEALLTMPVEGINGRLDRSIDNHVHTSLCKHASGTMEEYVQAGIALGLRKIIFLEHLEVGIHYRQPTWLSVEEFDLYFAEGEKLRRKYADQIRIGLGVEAGYNPARVEGIIDILGRYSWDAVGLSYHFMEIDGRHYNLVSRRKSNMEILGSLGVSRVVARYFQIILEAVEKIPADFVCHLDAVMRHHPQTCFNSENDAVIDEIFAAMAAKGMALEVNFSGIRIRGEPYPAYKYIRRAVEKGVRLVAGSDAHRPQDVGRFDKFTEALVSG